MYNYTFCGIINEIAIVIMLTYESFEKTFKEWVLPKKIAFILIMYFACFSHLFHSEMVGIFCGIMIIIKFFSCQSRKLADFMIYICGVAFWMMAIVFEMSGGRSRNVSGEAEISFITSVNQLKVMVLALSSVFKLAMVIAIVATAIYIIASLRRKNDEKGVIKIVATVVINEVAVLAFLIILNSILKYMSRIEASYAIWAYLILLCVIGIYVVFYVLKSRFSRLGAVYVLAVFAMIALIWLPDGKYSISTVNQTDYETCTRFDNYIISQVVSAAENDDGTVHKIVVPMLKDEKFDWAFPDESADVYVKTLYQHGFISHKIDTVVVSDYDFFN